MKTAVEWLIEQLTKQPIHDINDEHWFGIIGEAKQMEKEQMEKVAGDFWNEGASYMHDGKIKYKDFEQYYNETFKNEKQ